LTGLSLQLRIEFHDTPDYIRSKYNNSDLHTFDYNRKKFVIVSP